MRSDHHAVCGRPLNTKSPRVMFGCAAPVGGLRLVRCFFDDIVDGEGRKVWWVADADLGAGPFRWLVYDRYRGKVLAASAPFHLPEASNQVVIVQVQLSAR